MRVAIVQYPTTNPERLDAISRGLAEGLQAQGHNVSIFNMKTDDIRLAMFDYLCIGYQTASIFGTKIEPSFSKILGNLSNIAGKRSYAFICKKMFGSEKLLSRLMRAMESQGLFLRISDILSSPDQAKAIGSTIEVAR